MSKSSKKKKVAKEAKPVPRRPRQQDLPEMEDRAIRPLQDAAHEYAETRDERMRLSAKEVKLAAKLLALMKANEKETYRYGDVLAQIVHESEKVKVKILAPEKEGKGEKKEAPEPAGAEE